IKEVIPSHCFERSAIESMKYVAWDLVRIFILISIASYVHFYSTIPIYISGIFWPAYWVVQVSLRCFEYSGIGFSLRQFQHVLISIKGTIMTGIWVIAHECGHGAFSPS